MNARRALIAPMLCLLSLTVGPGCGAGKAYDIGRQAEERGDAHLAHDYYVRAGTKRPGNSAIREGLKRTAPAAVEFWRKQAAVAESQGRYDDAWRMLMRALRILPSDQQSLEAIHSLEAEHGLAVASAKADYLQRGAPALQVELARLNEQPPTPTSSDQQEPTNAGAEPTIASAEPNAATPDQEKPANEAIAQTFAGSPAHADSEAKRSPQFADPKTAAAAPQANDPFELRFADSSKDADERPDRLTPPSSKPKSDGSPIIKPSNPRPIEASSPRPTDVSPPKKIASSNDAAPPAGVHGAPVLTEKEYDEALKKRQADDEDRRPPREFLIVRTFSRNNDKFPKEAPLVDGVKLKLKDTDDELDADMNLYIDGKRVKKIRDLPIGRPASFQGKSGKTYTLMILSIHHKSHTVRLGINPE